MAQKGRASSQGGEEIDTRKTALSWIPYLSVQRSMAVVTHVHSDPLALVRPLPRCDLRRGRVAHLRANSDLFLPAVASFLSWPLLPSARLCQDGTFGDCLHATVHSISLSFLLATTIPSRPPASGSLSSKRIRMSAERETSPHDGAPCLSIFRRHWMV